MFTEYEEYFRVLSMDKSKTTIVNYHSVLDRFIEHFGISSLNDLNCRSTKEMREYQEWLLDNLKSKDRDYATRSCNAHLRVLRAFVNWMIEAKYLDNNFLEGIHTLKEKNKPEAVFLTIEERDAMIRFARNDNERLMFIFMFMQGLRRNETSQIKVSDIKGNKLTIHEKGGKTTDVKMNEFVEKSFNEYIEKYPNKSEYLFVSKKGFASNNVDYASPITNCTVRNRVKSVAMICGIDPEKAEKVSAHTTRRSFACELALMHEGAFSIQAGLRHKDVRTTQRYIAPALKILGENAIHSLPAPVA
jgi:integrase